MRATNTPNGHDYDQLQTIYSHPDTTNTSASQTTNFGVRVSGRAAAALSGLNNDAGDSPAEWGRAIGNDGKGRANLFVQELGKGQRKITHVFWLPGEGPPGHAEHHD